MPIIVLKRYQAKRKSSSGSGDWIAFLAEWHDGSDPA
jgi:hypothetical protein